MERFFFFLHSGFRWLAVLALVVAFVWLLIGILRGREYDRMTHRIMVIFSSAVGLQWVLGILVLLFYAFSLPGGAQGYHWVHLIIMTIAVAAAHMYIPLKSRSDSVRYRGGLAIIIATLVLIILGVAVLPGMRWGFSPSI